VQENPENFFGNIDNLLAPDSVWSWPSHLKDESDRPLRLTWFGVAKIRQKDLGSVGSFRHWS
jgi:hypothetical protein